MATAYTTTDDETHDEPDAGKNSVDLYNDLDLAMNDSR